MKDAGSEISVVGNTEMKVKCGDMLCTFHAYPMFQGKPWYDWAYVQYVDDDNNTLNDDNISSSYYPSLILGFIQFSGEETMAVIRTSLNSLS